LGGGGLTCGLSEMAAKRGTGMEIDLDYLRTREPDMRPSEIMISESQERMILIVRPADEEKLAKILDKWELGYSRIGHITRDGILLIRHGQVVVARAPARFVAEAPLAPRSTKKPAYLDPYWGTVGTLSAAFSNLVASGAEPVAIVDHLQYGDPGNPEVYWTFKEAIRAMRDYLNAVRVPCIGGKVSFYNEDSENRTAIKPSPVISALGLRDARTPKIDSALQSEGDDLLIVGTLLPGLGGSEYYESVQGLVGGQVPRVTLRTERTIMRTMTRIVKAGLVEAAHDFQRVGWLSASQRWPSRARKASLSA